MKKLVPLSLLLFIVLLASCSSNEEKAEALIKKELSKQLYDFDSYQPLETTVKEAKMTIYNDSTCWNLIGLIVKFSQEGMSYSQQTENLKEEMDMWKTIDNNLYNKSKKQYEETLITANKISEMVIKMAEDLKVAINELDTTQVIGWEVSHSFRCNTRGGDPTINHYRYIISKDFKSVLLCEDRDDLQNTFKRGFIEYIKTGDTNSYYKIFYE